MEDPQLSSYPLKVATLHYSKEKFDQPKHGLFVDALNILRKIDDHKDGHSTLRSFTIANEPIFKEHDKSHLQVRRLAAPLRDIESEIFTVGLIQTMLLFVPLTVTLLLLIYTTKLNQNTVRAFRSNAFILKAYVLSTFHFCVILWLSCEKICGKETIGLQYKSKILYKSTTWPLYLHSVFFVLNILYVVMLQIQVIPRFAIKRINVVAMCELSIMLCFVIGVLVATKYRLIKCRWQWIFLGTICKKTASKSRLNRYFNQHVKLHVKNRPILCNLPFNSLN